MSSPYSFPICSISSNTLTHSGPYGGFLSSDTTATLGMRQILVRSLTSCGILSETHNAISLSSSVICSLCNSPKLIRSPSRTNALVSQQSHKLIGSFSYPDKTLMINITRYCAVTTKNYSNRSCFLK